PMDTFFVVGFSGDFGATAAQKKMRLSPQFKKLLEDTAKGKDEMMLLWAYKKGVKTQESGFGKSSRDRTTWSLDWNQDGAIWRQEYSFGFTLRFRMVIYVNHQLAADAYGQCEIIPE